MDDAPGILYSCWVQERKQKVIKKWATMRRNTTAFEFGTMEQITMDQL